MVSKTELLEHLYDYNWEKFSNVIEVYISGLRRKIDDDESFKLIHTMRGHGYVLRGDSQPSAGAVKPPQAVVANARSGDQARKSMKH